MTYFIAVIYFIIFCIVLRIFDRVNPKALMMGIMSLIALIVMSEYNGQTGLIEEKVASFVSYDMFKGGDFQIPFLVQYIFAYVPFALLDYEYSAHGMNMGIQAFSFLLGVQYVFKGKIHWLLPVFMLFPSYFHYSIFGLRDPMISLVTLLIVISAINTDKKRFVQICIAFAVVSIGLRPEFSMIILGFAGVRLFVDASKRQRIFIFILGLIGLYGLLLVMPIAFGLSSTGSAINNVDLMVQFNELRANRRLGQEYGDGSHILGGQLYSYDFLVRYPIQVLASFVAPLPVDIRGALDLLAFGESVLFCFIVFLAAKKARLNRTALVLFLCGAAYMVLQAIFAANYGNILRVRYPAFIFFLAASVSSGALSSIPRKRVRRSARN